MANASLSRHYTGRGEAGEMDFSRHDIQTLAVAWPGVLPFLAGSCSEQFQAFGYLNKHGMAIFGYYRVILVLVVGVLLLTGHLN